MVWLFMLGLMRTHRLHFIFLASLIICSSGCVSVTDISHDSLYPTDYIKEAVYQFKQPVFAEDADSTIFTTYHNVILELPDNLTAPRSIQEYTNAPKKWEEDVHIAGLVQAGTKIRIVDIQLMWHPENGETIWIKGKLLDAPWANIGAELHFISRNVRQIDFVDLPFVNTNILELVTKP